MDQEAKSCNLLLALHFRNDYYHAIGSGLDEFHGQRKEKFRAAHRLDASGDCYMEGQLAPQRCLKKWPPTYRQQLPDGILQTRSPDSDSTLAVELRALYRSVPYFKVYE